MKKIIVKESQLVNITENVIREQFSDDPNAFTTEVKDVSFYGLEKYFSEYEWTRYGRVHILIVMLTGDMTWI